jgi:LL-diaminopimelate aminotransferase
MTQQNPQVNPYFSELPTSYIFSLVEEKLAAIPREDKESMIDLSIGDIALPLGKTPARALCIATEEMTSQQGKRGYGPSEGYDFLRRAICKHEYAMWGILPEEIFISDGANSDTADLQELFTQSAIVAMPEPTYPVYYATNVLAGRKKNLQLLPCTEENAFLPHPPTSHCDLIYLCSPSNPIGIAMDHTLLKEWVDYAHAHQAILIVDNTYAAFVSSAHVPPSIYAIEGAREVAIECRSFSKNAGFTGLRCAYSVLPRQLMHDLHALWRRRQIIKSNGVAYPIQRAAEALFSEEGQQEIQDNVETYLESGRILKAAIAESGYTHFGGTDAPYIWWKSPNSLSSWKFFEELLDKCHIVGIPGSGFGSFGEGYLRLSTFAEPKIAHIAASRIRCALF